MSPSLNSPQIPSSLPRHINLVGNILKFIELQIPFIMNFYGDDCSWISCCLFHFCFSVGILTMFHVFKYFRTIKFDSQVNFEHCKFSFLSCGLWRLSTPTTTTTSNEKHSIENNSFLITLRCLWKLRNQFQMITHKASNIQSRESSCYCSRKITNILLEILFIR